MTLGELIKVLEEATSKNPERILNFGFHRSHSYRGFYECLAFEPQCNVRIADMLAFAKEANGRAYCGWKDIDNDYVMDENSQVYLARIGCTGNPIDADIMKLMLAEPEV